MTSEPSTINQTIVQALSNIEHTYNVTILFACESGSRAWDIASPDSDYDIRFIYQPHLHHYLTLDPKKKDTIQQTITTSTHNPLDLVGFDLRKALQLSSKSNPSIIEWLESPITYIPPERTIRKLHTMLRIQFNPVTLKHHYRSLITRHYHTYWPKPDATNPFQQHLDEQPISLKKYLYAIRPLLAINWMEGNHNRIPPISLPELLPKEYRPLPETQIYPDPPADELTDLLHKKSISTEQMGKGRYPNLDKWIYEGIEFYKRRLPSSNTATNPNFDELQKLFWDAIIHHRTPPSLDK